MSDVPDLTSITRQVVAAAYRAFATHDIPALLALLDPAVAWGQPDNPSIPSAGTRHRLAGVQEWLQVGNETEEILAFQIGHMIVDGPMAAVSGSTTVRVRATGATYTTDFVHLVTVASGRVTRFQESFDTDLAAAAFAGRPD